MVGGRDRGSGAMSAVDGQPTVAAAEFARLEELEREPVQRFLEAHPAE